MIKKNLIDMIAYGIKANNPFMICFALYIYYVRKILLFQYRVLGRETP